MDGALPYKEDYISLQTSVLSICVGVVVLTIRYV